MGDRLATLVATGLGSGFSPFAPGTAGSAVGLLLFVPLAALAPWLQLAAAAALFPAGVWAATRLARRTGLKDPGLVVVDEIVGMWVALLFLPFTPLVAAVAFFAFRAMDVIKPYPARDLEGLPEGWGIMADDVAAGVYANAIVRVVSLIWPLG